MVETRSLRIVTWNCAGALRKKWQHLQTLDADVYIIQECEDPSRSTDAPYQIWASNHLWTGENKNKGVGVFARSEMAVERVDLNLDSLKLFLPCRINGAPLLATWTQHANSPTFEYIGQLWKFLQAHRSFLDNPRAMVIGDLNSNSQWDKWDRWWNHSDVVRTLEELGLRSAYHESRNLPQGNEPDPTFFLQRNESKAYHIDYVFMGREWTVGGVEVGHRDQWLPYSDHMPLVCDLLKFDCQQCMTIDI